MRTKIGALNNNKLYTVAFSAGVIGAATMTVIMAIARGFDLTAVNIEMMLGSMLTATTGGGTWLVGLVWHLINGGIFALFYAAGFRAIGRMDTATGVGFGLVHWVVAGVIIGIVGMIHPLMPELMSPPGFYAVNTGVGNMTAILILHLIYGGIVGAICQRKAGFLVVRTPETEIETRRRTTRGAA